MKSELKTRKSGNAIPLRKARLLLAALALTGAFVVPSVAQAAVQTEPMVVTDKDKVIDDDFYVVIHKYPEAIYVDPASTGTVQVNSQKVHVKNSGETLTDIGVIDTGYGWTGTLNLKDGMQVSGEFTGADVNAKGLQLNGFEFFTKDDDTGAPYAGTAHLGNNLSLELTADNATDYASLSGIEVDGENLQAGDGLSASVSAHTGGWTEVQGLYIPHYGTARLGDHVTIHTSNRIDQDSTHNLTDGIVTVHNFNNEKVDEPAKGRQFLAIGKEAVILTEVHNDQNHTILNNEGTAEGEVDGVRLSHTDFSLGDRAQITTKTTGAIPNEFGIYTDYHTQAVIGNDMTNTVTAEGRVPFVIGIQVKNDKYEREVDETVRNTLTIGERGKTIVSSTGDGNIYTRGIDIIGGQVILKDDNTLQVFGKNTHAHGNTAYTEGVRLTEQGSLKAGNNLQLTAQAINGTQLYGLEQNNSIITIGNHFTNTLQAFDTNEPDGVLSLNSQLTIGDDSLNNVQAKGDVPYFWITGYDIEGKTADGTPNLKLGNRARAILSQEGNSSSKGDFYGIYINNALAKVGNEASFVINGNIEKPVSGAATQIRGIYSGNGTGIIGDNLTIHVSGHNYAMVSGLAASAGNGVSSLSVGDNAKVTVSATEDETGTTNGLAAKRGNYIAGIKNWGKGSSVIVGKNADIEVTAPSDKDTSAVWTTNYAETNLGDSAVLKLNSTSTNVNATIMNQSGGKTTFTGGAMIYGSKNAIESSGTDSTVSMTGNGRKVVMGDLLSEDSGTMDLNLDTGDSLFRGKSTVNGGTTDLTLANGGWWDMTADSTVSTLTHNNGGIVNMQYNPFYQKLDVGTYKGNGGIFRMKTDLAQDNASGVGDKVYMTSAAAGASGKIQVHDESFLTGKEVTGEKHELLITDDSGNATFTGMTLDEGGLWDVTPTIRNGSYVRNVMGYSDALDTEWYLTKLKRTINESTKTLLHSTDNTYALYRNSMDTLRQRMGDLRFRNKKEDVSGLWARDTHGAYGGSGVYSKYNRLQLGYDYAANEKSIYGFLFERGIGNPRYENGRSKDHTFAGALYGTWFVDNGSYTDVVAKVGRDDTTLHSYGQYPDSASFRTREESLSVEYGRTHTLNDKGLFLEPQTQMVFGHLDSKDYTTARGKTVHMDSFNSAIGRIGLLLGQRKTEGNHPFDYYAKVSVLHEFGGNRDYYLTAPDGETMNTSEDYRDTWYEAGFGGTYRINGSTYLYADGEREFGGKWNRKWQWNVGIHWQF